MKKHASRKEPWTQAELEDLIPDVLTNRGSWKLTASHNSEELDGCIDGDKQSRYTTGKSMRPVAEGNGDGAVTKIDFDPVEARFVRITQTGKNKLYWSIHDLKIHGEG